MADEEWALLQSFSPRAASAFAWEALDLAACRRRAGELLQALPPRCQLGLLRGNLWALKPSLNGGGNGRGIVLMDRLPRRSSELLRWVAAVGRGGTAGAQDAQDGCLLQKLVEEPHLLDQQLLGLSEPGGPGAGPPCAPGLFKYNLRLWVLSSMGSPPSVWLYRDSYVDLAARTFTEALHPESHITNLLRGHRDSQRYWPIPAFAAYLQAANGGRDVYRESIWPQARAILRGVFRALEAAPPSLLARPSSRLKRLGVDLLVDARHTAWLLEFNVLRNEYGLKAARGQETKRQLAQRLVEDEAALKAALASGAPVPPAWEDLGDLDAAG